MAVNKIKRQNVTVIISNTVNVMMRKLETFKNNFQIIFK